GRHRKWRLVARLAAKALDRVEDRGLLAADVGAPSLADLDLEAGALPHHVAAEQAARPRSVDGPLQPLDGKRVLPTDVDVTELAAGRLGGDGHRLDDRERVPLHEHAILESARLRLVGIADQVMRPHWLPRDGLPLAAGGESRAAAPRQLRIEHLANHAFGSDLEGATQRLVSAVGPVIVEARRIDHADALEE